MLTEFRNYQDGVMPAGPGARELTEFFSSVDGDLTDHAGTAPNVLTSDQQVLNLLGKRAGALHLGLANYCWFTDPSRAMASERGPGLFELGADAVGLDSGVRRLPDPGGLLARRHVVTAAIVAADDDSDA